MRYFRHSCGAVAAVFIFLISDARAQDASIEQLLKKLPPPEQFVRSPAESALRQKDPALDDAAAKEAMLALQARNFSRAANLAHQLLVRYPQSYGAQCLNATTASALGQIGEATFSVRQAIRLRPDLAVAHFMFGNLEIAQQHYDAALPHFQKAAELEPKNPIALIFLSECCAKLGRPKEGLDYAKRATVAAPGFLGSWVQLARVEKSVGQMDETLSALKRAADLSPDNAQLLAAIGSLYLGQNRVAEAIPLLQHAAELAPNEAFLQSQLGQAYQKKGRHHDAAKAFEQATRSNPADRVSWEHLAEEYRALGRKSEAGRAAARARLLPTTTPLKSEGTRKGKDS